MALPSICNIRRPRNPNFHGRAATLTELAESLSAGSPAPVHAIRGESGLGKTEVLLEYAYRHARAYEAIWWIRAGNPTTLAVDMAAFAAAVPLPSRHALNGQVRIQSVVQWMKRSRNWLMIFDDAGHPDDLGDYLPDETAGHVLIASRHHDWGDRCPCSGLEPFARPQAASFLLRRTGKDDRAGAAGVAGAIEGFPLALELAAAYLNEGAIGFDAYLDRFRNRQGAIAVPDEIPAGCAGTLAAAFELAFERAQKTAPLAAMILKLCAYLASGGISRATFTAAGEDISQAMSGDFNDALVTDAIAALCRHALLVDTRTDGVHVHRLVQCLARSGLEGKEETEWSRVAVHTVGAMLRPPGDGRAVAETEWARLIAHGLAASRNALTRQTLVKSAAELLDDLGADLHARGFYLQAEPLYRRALGAYESQPDSNPSDLAMIISNLAALLRDFGTYAEAETLFTRSLEILEARLGTDNPDVATALSNLALLLQDQERWADAQALYRRAVGIRKVHLGEDHPLVGVLLANWAGVLQDQGKNDVAAPLFRRARQIFDASRDADFPEIAPVLNNMGVFFHEQAKYRDAEPLYRKALQIAEAHQGRHHPDVAVSLMNLALLLQERHAETDAIALVQRALAICQLQFGEDHPVTASCLSLLAGLLQAQGDYEGAESSYRRAIEKENANPFAAATALNDLALSLQERGRDDDAEPLYHRAIRCFETHLGHDHPEIAITLTNLAALLRRQGRGAEAMPLYRRALSIRERALGDGHPDTASSLSQMAELLREQGEHDAADGLLRRLPAYFETR